MKIKISAILAIIVMMLIQLACNLPIYAGGGEVTPDIPSPNKTLTALFAITPPEAEITATSTLPPVVTATTSSEQGGGISPTDTSQPAATATTAPTATNTPTLPPPTATLAPTATRPAPTATVTRPAATATVPNVRVGVQAVANFLSTPPTLDGDWSEWKNTTKEYPANHVVFGKQNWTGEDDLAGSFHVGWDNDYLYLAVKVRDDKYVQNATGENIFKGDSIEILLDTKLRDDFYTTRLSPDDFQLGINPGRPDANGVKEAYLWFPSNIAGARNKVQIASRNEDGIYRVEVAIPWSVFEVTPASGMHMGFALSVSDNDNQNENIQQTMVSNIAGRKLLDPTTWGDLHLVK